MSQKTPVVFCGKRGDLGPLILSGCGLALPFYHYEGSGGSAKVLGGDKTRFASPAEDAWLRAHYPTAPMARILRVTGRNAGTLKSITRRLGLVRDAEVRQRIREAVGPQLKQARIRAGLAWPEAQSRYVRARHKAATRPDPIYWRGIRPDRLWPIQRGSKGLAEHNAAVKADIMAAVAELGPARTWEAIRHHAAWGCPVYARSYMKRQREKRARVKAERVAV